MILLCSYLLIIKTVLKNFEKKLGTFNFIFFFTVFHIAYTLMIPLEILFFNEGRFSSLYLGPNKYIFWSLISYLGFIIPFSLIKNVEHIRVPEISLNLKRIKRIQYVLFFYFFSGFIFFRGSILKVNTYQGNIELSENSVYKFYVNLGIFITSVLISIYVKSKKYKRGIILMMILILWGMYSSDKNPILIGALGFLLGINNKLKHKKSFIFFVLIILLIPILSILFSSYRSGNINNVDIYRSMYSNSDPKGPFRSVIHAEKNLGKKELLYGESYLNSLLTWVPSKLWKNRPEDLSIKFAKENISDYHKGLGLGFSPLAEGVINFGNFGPFIHYLFTAICLILLLTFLRQFKFSKLSNYIILFFILTYLVLMHRSPFNLPAEIIRGLLPVLLIFHFTKFSIQNENITRLPNK